MGGRVREGVPETDPPSPRGSLERPIQGQLSPAPPASPGLPSRGPGLGTILSLEGSDGQAGRGTGRKLFQARARTAAPSSPASAVIPAHVPPLTQRKIHPLPFPCWLPSPSSHLPLVLWAPSAPACAFWFRASSSSAPWRCPSMAQRPPATSLACSPTYPLRLSLGPSSLLGSPHSMGQTPRLFLSHPWRCYRPCQSVMTLQPWEVSDAGGHKDCAGLWTRLVNSQASWLPTKAFQG
ncbi:unnamed protein product [Eretmochelys imbricata]